MGSVSGSLRLALLILLTSAVLLTLGCSNSPVVTATNSARETEVHYEVRRLDGASSIYRIIVTFPGSSTGKTPLYIPREWASAKGADKGIHHLRALSPETKIVPHIHPTLTSVVEHPPGALVTLAYDLVAIDREPPHSAARTQYLPILQPAYLHWIGYTAWVVPWHSGVKKGRLTFDELPHTWTVATSFGNGREVAFDWNPNTFAQSLVVAGDFRLVEKRIGTSSNKLTFAIRGVWGRDDETFARRLVEIVDRQRNFWRDADKGDYLVTLLPIELYGPTSMTGTALLKSFTSLVTPDNSPERIEQVWVHESLHQWLPRAFGGLEEPQAKLYWFSEGFTDYYTHLLMLRARQRNLAEFVDEINTTLQKLSASKHAGLRNDDVATGFHTDREIGKLAYYRGLLLAASWDNDIRAASNGERSLDDAMRWLLEDQRRKPSSRLTRARIEAMAKQFGVANAARDVDRFIELAEPIKVRVSALLPCTVEEHDATRSIQRFRVVEVAACATLY